MTNSDTAENMGLTILENLYHKNPNNPQVKTALINACYQLDQMEKAMSLFNQSLEYYKSDIVQLDNQPIIENNTIQSLWIGESLSKVEELCLSSFLYHGHEVHLYIYDNVKNIPDGVVIKDANDILHKDNIFYTHNNSVAHFADLFRWSLIKQKRGILG